MLNNDLLLALVTFARTQTLAKTAAALHVTQPTVTRGMQKLESDLNVQLFNRQPNKITLTATGKLAATSAAQLLHDQQAFVTQLQNFERNQRRLVVMATLPGPLVMLDARQSQLPANLTVDSTLITDDQLAATLTNRRARLVFSNQEVQTATIESRFLGIESLVVHLQKFMYQANQPTITFKELRGLSFVMLDNIGDWRHVSQQLIPDAKFLYQDDQSSFQEIAKYSDFPYFSTNVSLLRDEVRRQTTDDNRVAIPISDEAAHMPIYMSYLKSDHAALRHLMAQFVKWWPAAT